MSEFLETWQLWNAFKYHLGEPFLMRVLGRSNGRIIRMYAQDPRFTDKRCKDPLKALYIIFSEMVSIGRGDVVRKAVSYLASTLEEKLPRAVKRLQPTLCVEILANFRAVAALQREIEVGSDRDIVSDCKQAAIDEIERTYAKYLQEQEEVGHATPDDPDPDYS